MEASASSLPRKCSPCLFIHHHGHHVHHHRPFNCHKYSRHNPESLPEASPGMKLERGHGFQLPQEEEKDEETVFMMTEYKEFFTKSEAKRRSAKDKENYLETLLGVRFWVAERKKAKNKGRNTRVRLSTRMDVVFPLSFGDDDMDQAVFQSPEACSCPDVGGFVLEYCYPLDGVDTHPSIFIH